MVDVSERLFLCSHTTFGLRHVLPTARFLGDDVPFASQEDEGSDGGRKSNPSIAFTSIYAEMEKKCKITISPKLIRPGPFQPIYWLCSC